MDDKISREKFEEKQDICIVQIIYISYIIHILVTKGAK